MAGQEKGTISLEACIVFPFFVMLMLTAFGFIMFFLGQYMVSHAAVQCADSLALDSFATEYLGDHPYQTMGEGITTLVRETVGKEIGRRDNAFSSNSAWYQDPSEVQEEARSRFRAFMTGVSDHARSVYGRAQAEAYAADRETVRRMDRLLSLCGIIGGLDGLDFSGSRVAEGDLMLVIRYSQRFVFDFQGLTVFPREITVRTSMWGLRDIE